MKPGFKYTAAEHPDECLREAFASATGTPKKRLPWIPPNSGLSDRNFWREHEKSWADFGFDHEYFIPDGSNEPDGFWIGIVPGYTPDSTHAVVMKGKKLWHDPAMTRVQRPHYFYRSIKFTPHADN